MDLGSILLIFGLTILVAMFVLRPLFDIRNNKKLLTKVVPVTEDDQNRSVLLAERDRILRALQELDFDHALGKIPEEDYPEQRAFLLKKGADVLKSLDEMGELSQPESAEARIEAEIAARRADAGNVVNNSGKDPDIETLIAARKREKSEKVSGFCPQCGKPVSETDQFCSKCGTTLS